ncbi:hypothetical protein [Nocardioides sp.]|uniref:hypothetical protein n=1 Tax=Nocardioides sp. TaxID=35761 RepID=UPI002ED10D88
MSSGDDRAGTSSASDSALTPNELLRAVFDGLNGVGVRWALLRGRATLGHPGGDVDLLVSAEDLDSFEDVVFELGAYTLPRLRVPGAWSRAVLRPSWHRFYVLSHRASHESVKLDVVTRLVYSKQLKLASHLEPGCLDRRFEDRGVYALDPSDAFWTVLLHCLLDKQKVTPHRAAELESIVAKVRRPSPGEEFFETLCPPGRSADKAISLVRNRDWDSLADLGQLILGSDPASPSAGAQKSSAKPSQEGARPHASGADKAVSRLTGGLRAAAVSAYPAVWRRAGLGVVPRILDVVEAGAVDATVLRLRRRPGRCEVYLLTSEQQRTSLGAMLRAEHYLPAAGRWNHLTGVGLETVHLVTATELALSPDSVDRLRETSLPMPGRTYCRRAVGAGPWLDDVLDQRRDRGAPR